jgi:hypothetical protein
MSNLMCSFYNVFKKSYFKIYKILGMEDGYRDGSGPIWMSDPVDKYFRIHKSDFAFVAGQNFLLIYLNIMASTGIAFHTSLAQLPDTGNC